MKKKGLRTNPGQVNAQPLFCYAQVRTWRSAAAAACGPRGEQEGKNRLLLDSLRLPAAGDPAADIFSFRYLILFPADCEYPSGLYYFLTRLFLPKKRTTSTAAAARKIPRYRAIVVSSPVFTEDCGT